MNDQPLSSFELLHGREVEAPAETYPNTNPDVSAGASTSRSSATLTPQG